mmetsp:Transcript_99116/g.266321  ORF Transcript_99116/g.266321 Transcript_99116/m.266321 type:complete len:281 (+) Transcript_99116:491-1333(+)
MRLPPLLPHSRRRLSCTRSPWSARSVTRPPLNQWSRPPRPCSSRPHLRWPIRQRHSSRRHLRSRPPTSSSPSIQETCAPPRAWCPAKWKRTPLMPATRAAVRRRLQAWPQSHRRLSRNLSSAGLLLSQTSRLRSRRRWCRDTRKCNQRRRRADPAGWAARTASSPRGTATSLRIRPTPRATRSIQRTCAPPQARSPARANVRWRGQGLTAGRTVRTASSPRRAAPGTQWTSVQAWRPTRATARWRRSRSLPADQTARTSFIAKGTPPRIQRGSAPAWRPA